MFGDGLSPRRLSATGVVLAATVVIAAGCAGGDLERERPAEPSANRLVVSAAKGDLRSVRQLLVKGVDVNARDRRGRTAVTAATMSEHVTIVRALLDAGADVDLQDDERNNPLLLSGENGNVGLLREVLRADPDLRATNRFGGTALIPASDRGHVETVRTLLETDIPVDHVNRLGWTALLEAVVLGDGGEAHQQIVGLLVRAGADIAIADRDGVTALQHARRSGYGEIARILEGARSG